MINNNIDVKVVQQQETVQNNKNADCPNESTGIYVRGFVKITDPETGRVLVETGK